VRQRGTVRAFDRQRGYGFIARQGGAPDLFVHKTAFTYPDVFVGDEVEFLEIEGPRGPKAVGVTKTEPPRAA